MPRVKLKPTTQTHWLVTSPAFPDCFFTEFSGVKEKKETTKYPDGIRRRTYEITTMTAIEAVTLATPYDPRVHDASMGIYERLRDSEEEFSVSVVPVDSSDDPKPIGKGFTLFGCVISGVEVAEVNRGSGDVSKLSLMMIPNEYKRG